MAVSGVRCRHESPPYAEIRRRGAFVIQLLLGITCWRLLLLLSQQGVHLQCARSRLVPEKPDLADNALLARREPGESAAVTCKCMVVDNEALMVDARHSWLLHIPRDCVSSSSIVRCV